MIIIEQDKGLVCPRIYCDSCIEPITDPLLANVLWTYEEPDRQYHTHKKCNWQFEHSQPNRDKHFLWEELDIHLMLLNNNCGLKGKQRDIAMRRLADYLRLGLVE